MEAWKAPESIITQRRSICEICDKYNKMIKICTECKCFVPFKTSVSVSNCPLNKWTEIRISNGN